MPRAALTMALVAAGALAASSAAEAPPPALVHFGVTHARPIAGHVFTGVTVAPATQTLASWSVTCAAKAGTEIVPYRERRYYDPQGHVAVVACSWKIPAKVRGPLRADVLVLTTEGGESGVSASWRIKRSR